MNIKFTKKQYETMSSFVKTLSEGIVLGGLAAFFLPEGLQIGSPISFFRFLLIFLAGLLLFVASVILIKKTEK